MVSEIESSGSERSASVRLHAELAESVTYASYQNAVPILRSLAVENATDEGLENCRLELAADPPFLRARSWVLDRLSAGERLAVSDKRIDLDPSYLRGLNEAERGVVTLTLVRADEVLASARIELRLLARDEWGGAADMAQLLPSFVMPNDPGIAGVLRAAAERLGAHGHPSGLEGYQSADPARAYMLAAAIYSAVAGYGLHYAEPPASFERRGQKVRRPATVLDQRLATCLDTTLLFAGALEAAGLNPVILLFEGHAAAGVWVAKKHFEHSVERDPIELRKAMASREFIVFETTCVTHRPPAPFESARALGARRLSEQEEASFVAAIDVRRARSGGVMPLASHQAPEEIVASEAAGPIELPLPPPPDWTALPPLETDVKPTTASGRIDRWQKKLLDLTTSNKLLNLRDGKKTIPLICPDLAGLEDKLSDGGAVRLVSLADRLPLSQRDPELHRRMGGRDPLADLAADALQNGELGSPLDGPGLQARLIELSRQVRNDLAEGGTNTLYLAIGFLRWTSPGDKKIRRAPLLLLPAKLERQTVTARFNLRRHEDEPRFNATLLHLLERDFDLKLLQLAGELPRDGNGVDVPRLLETMRLAVRDGVGLEVVDEAALSTFSFAKYLMWKDLVDRTDALKQNRVVRHLIDSPEQPFTEAGVFVAEREIDRRYEPADIVTLLPADSSQIAASLAAADGQDFVLRGPPGTGKSQTIANMIGHCLANGRTVLFVAEKATALNVVARRLREHGLGDRCLELHSNKTDRRQFLSQLKRSWESGAARADEWVTVNARLRVRRDELNAYVEALHRPHRNGLTSYDALGLVSRDSDTFAPELAWGSADAHDAAGRALLEGLVDDAQRAFAAVRHRPAIPFVDQEEWRAAWEAELVSAARHLADASTALEASLGNFLEALGLDRPERATVRDVIKHQDFAVALQATRSADGAIVFESDLSALRSALGALGGAIQAYAAAEAQLSARFERDEILRVPVADLDLRWREAAAAFWPMGWFGRRRVRKLLRTYAAAGKPDPERDLPVLRRLQALRAEVDGNGLAGARLGFAGLDSDLEAIDVTLDEAARLRASLADLGQAADAVQAITRAVSATLERPESTGGLRAAAGELIRRTEAFRSAVGEFSHAAKCDPKAPLNAGSLSELVGQLEGVVAARVQLRDWSSWRAARNKAAAHGLEPLLAALENGDVQPERAIDAFRLAYARWWAPLALDGDPVLCGFRRFQHEHAISEFRALDDAARKAASARIVKALTHDLPSMQSVGPSSELGKLRHQINLTRPSKSIRETVAGLPTHFAKLAPCMLMSPLSIAQYLPTGHALFDVVIFDEASQITTWDAVGAIARARQTIIVGDPKQLPPTNFFGRNDGDGDGDGQGGLPDKDLESILDEVAAAGIPTRDLRWHYRSRHESLIAFSNQHYYGNRLITFPSAVVDDRAVKLRHVPEGVYDRGKSRTNAVEARAVVTEAVARMKGWLALPADKRPSLGVITFNVQQQKLIQDLLDEARRDAPEIEWFFDDDGEAATAEPVMVWNLENVQGDQRDVMLFSIGVTQDQAGKRSMSFGLLNNEGGERRLNVAVTRAADELLVFSGTKAEHIDLSRTKALGVAHLKAFLDYAERGPLTLAAQDAGSVGEPDSPFEEAVLAELERRGWQVVPQVGVSGYRVDIGIKHPDQAGRYLAGVECDGAAYHSSATARDRDKVREEVLRGLGWNIVRVWSTEWFYAAEETAERLHAALEALLADSRAARASSETDITQVVLEGVEASPLAQSPFADVDPAAFERALAGMGASEPMLLREGPAVYAAPVPIAAAPPEPAYIVADLSKIAADPERFHEADYRATLLAMIEAVMAAEAPVRDDILAQRIARAHGWQRTGSRIRDRIDAHLRGYERTAEGDATFLWRPGSVADLMPYRPASDPGERRSILDTPLAELAGAAARNRALLDEADPPLALARALGVERLSAPSRSRLEAAIARVNGASP
jgi:very-short-patch-repair endonuclease